MKIYVASSWRNTDQPALVDTLRNSGHLVYDFRNPHGEKGFAWSDIRTDWQDLGNSQWPDLLTSDTAERAFKRDVAALAGADAVVLLLPCGKSAHMEFGFAAANEKQIKCVLLGSMNIEPELMYSWADAIFTGPRQVDQLIADLASREVNLKI